MREDYFFVFFQLLFLFPFSLSLSLSLSPMTFFEMGFSLKRDRAGGPNSYIKRTSSFAIVSQGEAQLVQKVYLKWKYCFLIKNDHPRPLSSFIFVFSIKHRYNIYKKCEMWKIYFHYMVPGFEHTTFGAWVSSHKH